MIPVIDIRNGRVVAVGQTMIHEADGSYRLQVLDAGKGESVPPAPGRFWYKVVSVLDLGIKARVTVHTADGARVRWLSVGKRATPFGRQRVAVYES
jgi:hypothetical protein